MYKEKEEGTCCLPRCTTQSELITAEHFITLSFISVIQISVHLYSKDFLSKYKEENKINNNNYNS